MTTSTSPDARRIWRAAKAPLVIGLVILVGAVALALSRGQGEADALDPRSVSPEGSRALARLLEAEGVRVEFTEAAPSTVDGATVLVGQPDRLGAERLAALRAHAAEVVLVAPQRDSPVKVVGVNKPRPRQPECALDEAKAAGMATMGGLLYEGTGCYPDDTGAALVRTGNTTLLGTGVPLTNAALDQEGNAALAMRLLGKHERLVWYLPSLGDATGDRSFGELVPPGWRYGAIQAAIAVVLLALWRARRLGPVVAEPLPVVVRAAETVEGRARLYRRAKAADHAALALRRAARDRLVPMLGLSVDALPEAVVSEVATRSGHSAAEVHALLYGPAPSDDSALVRLADDLDRLENEVREA